MFIAQPFLFGKLNKDYQKFLSQPFKTRMLGKVDINHVDNSLFIGWSGSATTKFERFIKDNNKIYFFGKQLPYEIIVEKNSFTFPFPQNIDQFICDCKRCGVDLHWNESIFDNLDPKVILSTEDYHKYITDILTKLDKLE